MYLVTHSLLSAWLYAMRDNPYEDMTTERDAYSEFLKSLRREPTETTEAMQNGIDFEDLVTAIINQDYDESHKWIGAARKVASIVGGGKLQYKAKKPIEVGGESYLLYGRLDVLKAGEIMDIKFSQTYDRGKYLTSTQHPTYLELIPEAEKFTYVISNGNDVWTETYRREETPSIFPIIEDFAAYLKSSGLWEIYTKHWSAL